MLSRSFQPFLYAQNFKGVNCRDSQENILDGEWDENSINIDSDPQGSFGSRLGFTAITTASVGATVDWCGFYQFDKHSGGSTTSYYLGGTSDGKIYQYISNAYTQLYTGLATTDDDDQRYSFFTLDNTVMILSKGNDPLVWTGTGSAATFATSVTADWGLEWQRYGWVHSTVDPRLMYYCATLGDIDSAYTSFLNFDDDSGALTGGCKQGDDMIIGKEFALFRVQYRGTTPLFKKYRIPSKIGPVTHFAMKELPDGTVIFLAPDFNFYLLAGDNVVPCGENIREYIKDGVNARLKYAVAGLLLNKSQYWCSFTYVTGETQNDRTVVMDWSRPYQDVWGKTQFPWFIYSIGANCFAEVTISGKAWLYHGGYTGLVYKDDYGTNDNGATYITTYKSKPISHGDPALEKKYDYFNFTYERAGDWDLSINLVCDNNAGTEKNVTENLLTGIGYQSLFDQAKFDEDYFSSESDGDTVREIGRQGKVIQVTMGTSGLDESWRVRNYMLHAKGLRRGARTRESS